MPSGPKKRRAQKKKKEIAADRKKAENEAPPAAVSEEMQTEITETVLPEKMLASQVLDLKRKDTEEGIKENALPTEISSTGQSLNVAEPLERSHADKIDVIVESSVVAAEPCVIQLESKDKDGGLFMSTFVSGFEGKEAKGATEYPVFSEIYSSLPVSEFHDATENLQDDDGGSVTASDDTAFSVMMDKAVESSTTEPDQRALEQKEDNAVKKQDLDLVVTANNTVTAINTVAVENEDIVVLNEDDGTRKIEEAFQENEVEVAVHNKEDATSEYFSETEKNALKAIAENVLDATEKAVQIHEVEAAAEKKDLDLVVAADNRIAVENQKISVLNEDEVTGKTEEAIQGNEVEAAVQNKEDAIAEDFNKNEKIALVLVAKAAPNEVDAPEKAVQVHEMEAVAEDQVTVEPNMVDAQEQIERAVPEAEVEAVIAAVVDYETHDAVSTELVRPEVGKQLKEIKEIVEDVLNRLNAVDALLLRN